MVAEAVHRVLVEEPEGPYPVAAVVEPVVEVEVGAHAGEEGPEEVEVVADHEIFLVLGRSTGRHRQKSLPFDGVGQAALMAAWVEAADFVVVAVDFEEAGELLVELGEPQQEDRCTGMDHSHRRLQVEQHVLEEARVVVEVQHVEHLLRSG